MSSVFAIYDNSQATAINTLRNVESV